MRLPFTRTWIGAKTIVLKYAHETIQKCPIIDCNNDTEVRADYDSDRIVERIYQVCVKCGTEFSALYTKRPEPKVGLKQVKQAFGG